MFLLDLRICGVGAGRPRGGRTVSIRFLAYILVAGVGWRIARFVPLHRLDGIAGRNRAIRIGILRLRIGSVDLRVLRCRRL